MGLYKKILRFFMKEVPDEPVNENIKDEIVKLPEEKSKKEESEEFVIQTDKANENNIKHECSGCGRKYFMKEEAEKCSGTHDCCAKIKDKKKGFINGIIYGLMPHTFCILFIIGSILGVTLFTSTFKPFLANKNFFNILMVLSFGFATLSALFYLKRNNCLCLTGAKKRWKFLSILYTTTVTINLLFFFVIFPVVANIPNATAITGAVVKDTLSKFPSLTLNVDIPCSGHAPLIIGELKSLSGVKEVRYQSGNFIVYYDSSEISKEEILALKIFKNYPAKIVSESSSSTISPLSSASIGGGSCGSGGCGKGCCGG